MKLKPEIEKRAKERMLNPMQNSSQGTTRDQVAKAVGVSHDTIQGPICVISSMYSLIIRL